jgi:hypothetical protein
MAVAKRRGLRRAIVAVARKLAIIMHRMWADTTTFNWSRETVALHRDSLAQIGSALRNGVPWDEVWITAHNVLHACSPGSAP